MNRRSLVGAAAVTVTAGLLATTAQAVTLMDGFGDADRNNNGAITPYDTDVDLNGVIDGGEISAAEDPADTGFIWVSTRGFTSSNTGDPKHNGKIVDDSFGAGVLGNGLAYGLEGKGSGSSSAGFFGQSVGIPNVGDELTVKLLFRTWEDSNNPTQSPAVGELRWGVFQDTDNQFGQVANEGLDSGAGQAPVVWGPDTGENDGDWRDSDPGPVGDKGIWARVPIGPFADPLSARINYEENTSRYLEGSSAPAGDQVTVASPPGNGTGGAIADPTKRSRLEMRILNTGSTLTVKFLIDGSLILFDEISATNLADLSSNGVPTSFDYIALRNTGSIGDWDFLIDEVMVSTRNVPEPASLALLGLGMLGLTRRRK